MTTFCFPDCNKKVCHSPFLIFFFLCNTNMVLATNSYVNPVNPALYSYLKTIPLYIWVFVYDSPKNDTSCLKENLRNNIQDGFNYCFQPKPDHQSFIFRKAGHMTHSHRIIEIGELIVGAREIGCNSGKTYNKNNGTPGLLLCELKREGDDYTIIIQTASDGIYSAHLIDKENFLVPAVKNSAEELYYTFALYMQDNNNIVEKSKVLRKAVIPLKRRLETEKINNQREFRIGTIEYKNVFINGQKYTSDSKITLTEEVYHILWKDLTDNYCLSYDWEPPVKTLMPGQIHSITPENKNKRSDTIRSGSCSE